MILKLSLLTLIFMIKIFAMPVLVSIQSIKFEEKIDVSKVKLENIDNLARNCEPFQLIQLETEEYITTHYINKNTVICMRDVKKYNDEVVIFNFGGLKIEKKGKIIYENNDFIRIKNLDGSIEQIYKDGRIK